jgi:hypothetical protein
LRAALALNLQLALLEDEQAFVCYRRLFVTFVLLSDDLVNVILLCLDTACSADDESAACPIRRVLWAFVGIEYESGYQ